MKILDLFDMYFLAMMVIQGSVVLTVDARNFKKSGNDSISKKARTLGCFSNYYSYNSIYTEVYILIYFSTRDDNLNE